MCGDKVCKELVNQLEWGNTPIDPSEYPEIFEYFHTYTCSKLIPGFNRVFIRASPIMITAEEIICTSCYIILPQADRKTYRMQRYLHKIEVGESEEYCAICRKTMLMIKPAASCQKCIVAFLNHEIELEEGHSMHHDAFED